MGLAGSLRAEAAEAGRGDGAGSRGRPLRRVKLADEVAAYLRGLILSGELRGGEFIRLDRVAQELDVSATPAREALLALRGDGLVELRPNQGFRVVALTRTDVEDVYLVQMQAAGELAARAAMRVTPALLEQLEEVQARLEEAAARFAVDELEVLNDNFHRLVNTAAASPKLAWFLGIALRYVPSGFYGLIPGWPEASLHDHESVVLALRAGDPDRARRAMGRHIQHAGELLVHHLDRRGIWLEPAPEKGTLE